MWNSILKFNKINNIDLFTDYKAKIIDGLYQWYITFPTSQLW